MNNYKKFLLILRSLGIISVISSAFAFALLGMFAINFWATFLLASAIQIIIPTVIDKYLIYKNVESTLEEYRQKPYKKYAIPLTCQYCARENKVNIDLEDTTFKCENCNRTNAIYVAFTTAAISDSSE